MAINSTYERTVPLQPESLRGAPQRALRAGFTLVELLWVLTISGVLLGIVVPRIDVPRFQLDAGVQEVASGLSSSRGQAVLQQHNFVVTFDVAGDRLFVLADANNNNVHDEGEIRRNVQLPDGVKLSRGGATALLGKTDPVSFTKESESLPAVTFHRNGAASQEGVVYLTSNRAAAGAETTQDTRALKIERATGRVVCMSFRTQAWEEGC